MSRSWAVRSTCAWTGTNRSAPMRATLILDLRLRRISNPAQLSLILNQIPGVVENGLFLDICDVAIIGNSDGTVEVRDIHDGTIEHERVDLVAGDNLFVDVVD
jgi:ribose 5-phosphate isomerase A